MNRQWKKYDQLMEKCYLGMAGGGADISVWNECFDVLIQIIEMSGRAIRISEGNWIFWTMRQITGMMCRAGWGIIWTNSI